jgi:NitT/TauT family transport system permease protein/taurine transport system permease protein
MLFACGGGILIGALVGGLALLRTLFLPVFSSLYAVPIVILYPIFTAWLGIGSESKIAFAAAYGFFPVMLSTAAGIRTIDPQYILAARSMGATLSQQITRVVIPASIPIGYLVTRYRTILDSPRVFAGILMILSLSVLFDVLARMVERRTLAWQTAGRRPRRSRDEVQAVPAAAPA